MIPGAIAQERGAKLVGENNQLQENKVQKSKKPRYSFLLTFATISNLIGSVADLRNKKLSKSLAFSIYFILLFSKAHHTAT